VTKSAKPRYPESARKAKLEGAVEVLVVIDETGRVTEAWTEDLPTSALSYAAIQAAYRFRFAPAEADGVPIRAVTSIPFRFSVTD
jgi:protein TonB